MNSVTADASLHESIADLNGLTQIRNVQGNVIGYFSPAVHEFGAVYSRAAACFDPDEMQRRKASREESLTTGEVSDRLKSLEQ